MDDDFVKYLSVPRMAQYHDNTVIYRAIVKFHEKLQIYLARYGEETLKKTAWKLALFYKENEKYKDSEFIKTLIGIVEFVIQKKTNSDWTVKKANLSMTGRSHGLMVKKVNRVPISEELSNALRARISKTAKEDIKTITESKKKIPKKNYKIISPLV